jgi:hypothetical protein
MPAGVTPIAIQAAQVIYSDLGENRSWSAADGDIILVP